MYELYCGMWWSRERSRKEDALYFVMCRGLIYKFPNLNLHPSRPSQPTSHPPKDIFEYQLEETKPSEKENTTAVTPSASVSAPLALPRPLLRRSGPPAVRLPILLQHPLRTPSEIGLRFPCVIFRIPSFPLDRVL
jgi:hypothetical protein